MKNTMYYPGCKIKGRYPKASAALSAYMKKRYGIDPQGCCKEDFVKLGNEDSALLICNNCAEELRKNVADLKVEYIYRWIDEDPSFVFPDYQGKKMKVQMCHHGYRDFDIERTALSLLGKMHIEAELLPEEVEQGTAFGEHMELCTKQAETFAEDVVTVCGICNLAYLNAGKKTHMLVELLFGTEENA